MLEGEKTIVEGALVKQYDGVVRGPDLNGGARVRTG